MIRPITGYFEPNSPFADLWTMGSWIGCFYQMSDIQQGSHSRDASTNNAPSTGFDANRSNSSMAGHANQNEIRPYNIALLPLISY